MPRAGALAIGVFLGVYAVVETQWYILRWLAGKASGTQIGCRRTDVDCQQNSFNKCGTLHRKLAQDSMSNIFAVIL